MRRSHVILFVILVGIATLVLKLKVAKETLPITQSQTSQSVKDILQEPISPTEAQNKTQSEEIPLSCQKSWNELLRNSFHDIGKSLESLREALGSMGCLKSSGYPKLSELLKNCSAAFENYNTLEDKEVAKNTCLQEMSLYRAYAIHNLTKSNTDYKNMSTRLLMNKLAALLSDPNPDVELINKIANALAENEPHLYAAQKANLIAKTISITSKDPNSQDFKDALEEYVNTLDKLNSFETDDPEATAAKLLPDVLNNNYRALEEKINSIVSEQGESGLTYYYRSGIEWKRKRVSSARNYLDQAIALEPYNTTYKTTRKKIASLKAGEPGAYSIMFKFDLTE
ncbi:MAG: hypothetical protein R3A80_02800 [Bdellovibrionota bacterium]